MTQEVHLHEGLYREGQDGPVLTGGRCSHCGFVGFPRAQTCPECGSEAVELADLGSQGRLLCETKVHMRTDTYASGYSVGYVTMAHGVRVFGQLHKPDGKLLRPGDPVKVEVACLWKAEGGQEVLCYRFGPMIGVEGGAT